MVTEIINEINGSISAAGQKMSGSVSAATQKISGGTSLPIMPSYPVYTGDTVVVPKTTEQVLETAQKLMTDDITVREVPFYEVSNLSGKTVYIASEV